MNETTVTIRSRLLRLTLLTTSMLVLSLAAFGIPAGATDNDGAQTEQPNVLILIADDLGVTEIGPYSGLVGGSDPATTPVLDRLAADGVRFDRAWSDPVCSSTRATVYTGRYGVHTGVGKAIDDDNVGGYGELRADEFTLAESLRAVGYSTALIGKWHLGVSAGTDAPLSTGTGGFDHHSGTLKGDLEDYYLWKRSVNGVNTGEEKTYATTAQVDDALGWIRDQSGPWMLTLAFNAPHAPFHVPPNKVLSADTKYALKDVTDADCDSSDGRLCYKAAIEAMDSEIGRLFDKGDIDPTKTVIIFMGDNGTPEKVLARGFDPEKAKGTVYQGGVHVPFIVAGPPVDEPGRPTNTLVNTVDIFPTISAITGAAPPAGGDWHSFLATLENSTEDPAPRDFLYTELFDPRLDMNPHTDPTATSAYSNGVLKVIERGNTLERCYDIVADPGETTNLWDPADPNGRCLALYDALEAGPHLGL